MATAPGPLPELPGHGQLSRPRRRRVDPGLRPGRGLVPRRAGQSVGPRSPPRRALRTHVLLAGRPRAGRELRDRDRREHRARGLRLRLPGAPVVGLRASLAAQGQPDRRDDRRRAHRHLPSALGRQPRGGAPSVFQVARRARRRRRRPPDPAGDAARRSCSTGTATASSSRPSTPRSSVRRGLPTPCWRSAWGSVETSPTRCSGAAARASPTCPPRSSTATRCSCSRRAGSSAASTREPATSTSGAASRGRSGEYYASPVASGGRLYLANLEGKVVVVKATPEWEVESVGSLDEPDLLDSRHLRGSDLHPNAQHLVLLRKRPARRPGSLGARLHYSIDCYSCFR